MKIYISADIEGVTGICHWNEAEKEHSDYAEFRQQMTKEVVAACQGAIDAGATELMIKDAHETGRNLILEQLPENARVIRGWSGHPLSMVQELDSSYAGLIMIGYHTASGLGGNPLSHSMSTHIDSIRINGEIVTEFHLHAWAAATMGVPVVFVSGDEELCQTVKKFNPNIVTWATQQGVGDSVISIHPILSIYHIEKQVRMALQEPLEIYQTPLPDSFRLEVRFHKHQRAYRDSFYPNARLKDPQTVVLETNDFFEVMRFLLFW